MKYPSILYIVLLLTITIASTGCSNSKRLTVAFTNGTTLEKGIQVCTAGLPIGYVAAINTSKNIDTIYTTLVIDTKIKIPKGSQFYLDENLVGGSRINIEFSKNEHSLNSKDISMGVFRPLRMMNSSKIDSVNNRLKIVLPNSDTIKKN